MSKLRGDDALLSLMDQMSSQQGYKKETTPKATTRLEQPSGPKNARVRLVSEVDGYPSTTSTSSSCHSWRIWNPYVQCSVVVGLRPSRFPPTNPQVEVFRRRAYERFKAEFKTIFERVATNSNVNVQQHTKIRPNPSKLWNQLSITSILERWHFAAKLEEFLQRQSNSRIKVTTTTTVTTNSTLPTRIWTTGQVQASMLQRQTEDGGITSHERMDPILITSQKIRVKRKREVKPDKNSTTTQQQPIQSGASLLQDEIQFEWTKAWRRIVAGSKEELPEAVNANMFKAKKFQRKITAIRQSLLRAAAEEEGAFRKEIANRAALEDKLTGPPSKKSFPKITTAADMTDRNPNNHNDDDEDEGDDLFVKFSGLSFRVHSEHYQKLQILFDRRQPSSPNADTHQAAFASALFCLLARYDMLQGAGLQSSMNGAVFDVLWKHFDCQLECFASPLNCRYERFCSAFPDTDAPFGSVGSFFDYDFATVGGCYQANPPFAANFILTMYQRMEKQLKRSVYSQCPLMFVVFVPTWKETAGWIALRDSTFSSRHFVLSQASHYYCEGTQHRRKDRYRVASFDTSVFFLQNETAREKWPITEAHIHDLTAAFQQNPDNANDVVVEGVVATTPTTTTSKTVDDMVANTPTSVKPITPTMDDKMAKPTKAVTQHNTKNHDPISSTKKKKKRRKLVMGNEEGSGHPPFS